MTTGLHGVADRLGAVTALDRVVEVDLQRPLPQLHRLRALSYHNLVKLFGGVPLRLTTPASTSAMQASE